MSSFEEQVLNGTYGKKKKKESSFADQVIGGTYTEPKKSTVKKTPMIETIKKAKNTFDELASTMPKTTSTKKDTSSALPLLNQATKKKSAVQDITAQYGTVKKNKQKEQKRLSDITKNENKMADLQQKLNTSVYSQAKKNEWQAEYNKLQQKNQKLKDVSQANLVGTGINTLIEAGKGIVDFSEGVMDAYLQFSSSKYNPFMHLLYNGDIKSGQDIAKDIIKQDASQNFIDNTLGYNKKLANGKTIQENIDKQSLITSKNFGGKVVRGIGRQLPSLMTGSEPASLGLMGLESYGGGVEEAYQNGATRQQANLYGGLNAGIEVGTEKMFAGVGGVLGKSPLDDAVKNSVNSRIKSKLGKEVADYALDMIGEGLEEVASDALNPLAKKATYAKDKDIKELYKEQNVLEDFLTGAVSAGVMKGMSLPSQISVRNQINNQNNTQVQNENIAPINTEVNEEENLPKLPTKNKGVITQNNAQIEELNENNTINQEEVETPKKQASNKQIAPVNTTTTETTTESVTELENVVENLKNLRETTTNKQEQIKLDNHIQQLENEIQQLTDNSSTFAQENKIQSDLQQIAESTQNENIQNTPQDNNQQNNQIYSEENVKLRDKAKTELGTTTNLREAGYLTTDGNYLDFSGKKQGASGGQRQMDHREVADIYDDDQYTAAEKKYPNMGSATAVLQDFMDKGNIRLNNTGVEIATAPTSEQYDKLYDYLDYVQKDNGDVFIDLDTETNNRENLEYNSKTSINKMINDIKEHYSKLNNAITATEGMQVSKPISVNNTQLENNNNVVYNNGEKQFNSIKEAIADDARKQPFAKYNTSIELFNLRYEDMKSVIAQLSNDAQLAKIQGLDNSVGIVVIDNKYYDAFFDLINQENNNNEFGVTKLKLIDEGVGTEYDNTKETNRYLEEYSREQEERNSSNSESIRNNKSARENDELSTRELSEQRTNESRQTSKEKSTNIRDVENTSFSNEKIAPVKEKTNLPMAKTDNVKQIKFTENDYKKIADSINSKPRSWIETSLDSKTLEDYQPELIKGLKDENLTYVVQSNKSTLEKANKKLSSMKYENAVSYIEGKLYDEKNMDLTDIALTERLIQEASKKGDYQTASDLIQDLAIMGTDLGQKVQALSLIKKLTPEGQLSMYQKIVNRAKAKGEFAFEDVEITPEMVKKVLDAYDKNGNYDQKDLDERVEQFKQDIADQLKSTTADKLNSWRYLSMLGNPKTHIRNIVSNVAMKGTVKVKNAMARTLESIAPIKQENRTKTWKKASPEVKQFAKQTAIEMKDTITGENKYNERTQIEQKKQVFKNKLLEKASNFNGSALEFEDWLFSKSAFQSTLQEYLTAQGIRTEQDIKNNPEIVEKGKQYAVEQAEIATFRQYSALAAEIAKIERKSKLGKFAIEALVPFKKTPINVAKAGANYSPLGLAKNVFYDTYQLQKGNINGSQFIDNLSQGMTGTGLTLLGYMLSKSGILTGSGDDDKEGKYDKQLGNQTYAVNLGGKSYSISWLSPVAMPLLVGANAYESLERQEGWDANIVTDSLASTLDPLSSMSFLSGLTDALNSYNKGSSNMIKDMGLNTLESYILQYVPTLLSQVASVTDDKKRSTSPSNNSKFKWGEGLGRQIMYKIPGLRQQLEVSTDIWGNDKEQSDNIVERAFETFLAPYSKTEHIATDVDKEIKDVYNETGDIGVIPGVPYGYIKSGDETYRMSAKEYTQYKKTYGQTANSTLNKIINSQAYDNASYDEKVKMIENTYKYARETAKQEYFDNNGVDYESTLLDKLDTLKDKYNVNPDKYFENKQEYDYAYRYPDNYNFIKSITSYDQYNVYKDKISDIKKNYTTTSGRLNAVANYVNGLNLSVPQKAMLIKSNYKSFKAYDKNIINYVNKQNLSVSEKTAILEKLGFTVRNGRVY